MVTSTRPFFPGNWSRRQVTLTGIPFILRTLLHTQRELSRADFEEEVTESHRQIMGRILSRTSITVVKSACRQSMSVPLFTFCLKDIFLFDISCAPFSNVYNFSDPDDAMLAWYDMPIIDKHAPLRKKRVKHPKLPP